MSNIVTRLGELEKQTLRLASAINELQAKIDSIQKDINTASITPLSSRSMNVLASPIVNSETPMIPEPMQRSMDVFLRKHRQSLTSEDVAKATGRSRHLESSYLCRLWEQGFLDRKRIGRKVYYSIGERIT